MIEARLSFFETNSSSSHTFIIPKDSIPLRIPKSINLRKTYSEDTVEYRIVTLYDSLEYKGNEQELLIKYLINKGCEVEGWSDDLELPASDTFRNEQELDKFLFGDGVIETYGYNEGDYTTREKYVDNKDDYDEIKLRW